MLTVVEIALHDILVLLGERVGRYPYVIRCVSKVRGTSDGGELTTSSIIVAEVRVGSKTTETKTNQTDSGEGETRDPSDEVRKWWIVRAPVRLPWTKGELSICLVRACRAESSLLLYAAACV